MINPADILPVNGIPKLVIANENEVVVAAAAWPSILLPLLIRRISIVRFATVVSAPSETY
jgi:hypothetical protein